MPTILYPDGLPTEEGRTLIRAITTGSIFSAADLPVNAHALWAVQGFAQKHFLGDPFPSIKQDAAVVNLPEASTPTAVPLTDEAACECLGQMCAAHDAAVGGNVFTLPFDASTLLALAMWAANILDELLSKAKPKP